MNAESETPSLVFEWEGRRTFRWSMLGLVLISAAAHALTFFLFQIAYPPRVSIPPPAPEVSLLLPTTPEQRAMLRRIEAEDPALVDAATSAPPPGLGVVQYHPSFETVRTRPRTVAEPSVAVQPPPAREPLAIIRSGSNSGPPAGAAPQPQPTRVRLPAALEARANGAKPDWKFAPRASAPLEPASFLVGVTDRGETRYVFLQHSSGDSALDRQIAAQLQRLDFQHGDEAIAWGVATIEWGDDAYVENPKPQ